MQQQQQQQQYAQSTAMKAASSSNSGSSSKSSCSKSKAVLPFAAPYSGDIGVPAVYGYWPCRDDFEIEYDNDAEKVCIFTHIIYTYINTLYNKQLTDICKYARLQLAVWYGARV
jgi:hypothetical protein